MEINQDFLMEEDTGNTDVDMEAISTDSPMEVEVLTNEELMTDILGR